MNERIANLRELIVDGKHKVYRRSPDALGIANLSDDFAQKGLSPMERSAEMLSTLLNKEDPVILPGERIVITRTITSIPDIFTETEYAALKNDFFLHEKGVVCNISPDYGTTIRLGLAARRQEIEKRMTDASLSEDQLSFLRAALKSVSALQSFIGKYAEYAEKIGETETARVLRTIRTEGAQSLREALQLLRALHFSLWEAGNYHNTLGRFDQYIYPYYQQDIEQGHLTQEEAFELVEEFFLMCNKDSDLYPGIQQGDNGQSLVLGGRDIKGNCLFNELSEMCLRASYELQLIDPKINIRVDKNTPEKIFEMGSQLTKIGLGFPQYSNDDVIIPGLIRKGYTPEDAHNYVVAACWEFIVPGNGMDIPNIDAISLVACVKEALPELEDTKTFEDFYRRVEEKIQQQANEKCTKHQNLYIFPAPMMSVLMDRCIADARDISLGNTYNNYGIHGTGIASAVDSLVAIKQAYFEEGRVSAQALLSAVDSNFATDKELQKELRELPKMGQDDDEVDLLASRLLDSFDKALMGKRNERGGVYRAGTGTAMYYIWHASDLGATPDGRAAEEMIPANYSPSLFYKQRGPLSVIKSFAKPNLTNVVNGGPLTLEFDQTVFNNDESVAKLGMLVRTFIHLGGHQLQLNTVNRDKLLDAQKHPEKYKNLIVRVWGWSGYFVELDECYQNHVINRIEFSV